MIAGGEERLFEPTPARRPPENKLCPIATSLCGFISGIANATGVYAYLFYAAVWMPDTLCLMSACGSRYPRFLYGGAAQELQGTRPLFLSCSLCLSFSLFNCCRVHPISTSLVSHWPSASSDSPAGTPTVRRLTAREVDIASGRVRSG